jgi:hypothetical protein
VGRPKLAQVVVESGMEIYTKEAVPMDDVGLVAWKMPKELLSEAKEEILLESLAFFNISLGLRVMMITLIRMAKIAMTMRSSMRVKDLW